MQIRNFSNSLASQNLKIRRDLSESISILPKFVEALIKDLGLFSVLNAKPVNYKVKAGSIQVTEMLSSSNRLQVGA